MDILIQSALLVALISFAMGFSVLSRNVKNTLYLAYSTTCFFIALWALFFFFAKIWDLYSFYRGHLFFNVWLGPVCLLFLRVLTRVKDFFTKRMFEFSILLAVSLSVTLGLDMEHTDWVRQLINFAPALIVIQTGYFIVFEHRTKRQQRVRKDALMSWGLERRLLIYLGAILVLTACVMDHVPMLGKVFPAIGNLVLTVYLFFLSQAISQQKLLNIGALISRFLVLIGVALLLTALYSLILAWIPDSPALFFLNSFIISFLILMMLDPLRTMVSYFTRSLLTQKQHLLENVLQDSQIRLTGIINTDALVREVMVTTEQTLQPEHVMVFLLRSDSTVFKRVSLSSRTDADLSEVLREVLSDHIIFDYITHLRRKGLLPILLDQQLDHEIERTASRTQRAYYEQLIQAMRAFRSNLLIPFFDADMLLGFVSVSVPKPPESWGQSWGLLQVLYPYYEQVGRTLRSMQVFVKSREKERLASLGEMAAGLAHEIRNPLGAIQGAVQLLNPPQDEVNGKFFGIIQQEVERLNRVVTQFLEYSRPDQADMSQKIDLVELIRKTVDFAKKGVPKNIEIVIQNEVEHALVQIVPEQIQQILYNLLQNSVKVVEKKESPRIITRVYLPGWRVLAEVAVEIEDNGAGIRKDHLEKIFIPFFTTSPTGTGLGLPISQKLAESNHGRIEVQTEEGRYCRFTLYLPLLAEKG